MLELVYQARFLVLHLPNSKYAVWYKTVTRQLRQAHSVSVICILRINHPRPGRTGMDYASFCSTYLASDQSTDIIEIFDEDKCRNVLVRYCAHIPRNYQYRDGIRLIFLVLRDHLGDEFLGLAGGVLYEMIEVDCHYSDDPGAAFQRWRHDHLNRHADLELPHIPHLTTVTSSIVPTTALVQWRESHPKRYSTRLSDYSPVTVRSSLYPSGIGTRKTWMIEHTMYVSSRNRGTRPFRQLKAREFHEMQWNESMGHKGRLIGEKSIDLGDLPKRKTTEILSEQNGRATHHRRSLSLRLLGHEKITEIIHKFLLTGRDNSTNAITRAALEQDDHSTLAAHDMFEERLDTHVSDCEIPNANFARKFGLFTENRPLPLFIRELPVAEDIAMEMATGYQPKELVYARKVHGPLTPQLWFDGGIDYRWKHSS